MLGFMYYYLFETCLFFVFKRPFTFLTFVSIGEAEVTSRRENFLI